MKKLTTILGALAICFAITGNAFSQRRSTPVYLNVTIEDQTTVTSDNQVVLAPGISSDGQGIYIHGDRSVSAQIGEYGYFTLLSGVRVVKAIYPSKQPLLTGDGTASLPVSSDTTITNVQITTFVNSEHLQKMDVGEYRCEGLGVNINMGDASATRRTIGYRAGRGTLSNTGYALTTRLSETTWTMESNSPLCSGEFNNIARIRDSTNKGKTLPDIDYGRYLMSFRLILTKQ